jgi:hypothetical protein
MDRFADNIDHKVFPFDSGGEFSGLKKELTAFSKV